MALRGFEIIKQRGKRHESFTQRVLCVEGIHVFQPAKLCCRCIFTEDKPINKKSCPNLIGTDFCGRRTYFPQLVNNAAEQFYTESIEEITPEQLERTFRSNIFSQFFLTRHCLSHMKEGSSIINTTSIVAYRGEAALLDYCSTKGAIVSFTRGLALQLAKRGIRVNGVAPGPIWTPLIPASFPAGMVEKGKWGENVPMKRPGQPFEVATSYVFLVSQDASYIAGQVLHPNGGAIVNA